MNVCIKCGQEVVRHELTFFGFWVLPEEATKQMASRCPAGGSHEVDDEDDE